MVISMRKPFVRNSHRVRTERASRILNSSTRPLSSSHLTAVALNDRRIAHQHGIERGIRHAANGEPIAWIIASFAH
jgi:hypothetical protein